jgi:hypothetical protein
MWTEQNEGNHVGIQGKRKIAYAFHGGSFRLLFLENES